MTFGTPAPPPPTDALLPPSEAPPAEGAAPPAPVTPPPHEIIPRTDDLPPGAPPADGTATGEPAFETYVAPPPPRPPTEEPPPEAPALPPEPAAAPPPPAPEPPSPAPAPPTPEPVAAAPEVAPTVMPSALRTPPEPAPAPVEERRFRAFPIVLVAGALLAAVVGFLVGGSDGGGEPNSAGVPTVAAANANMKLKVPSGWSQQPTVPEVPGLASSDPAAYGSEPGGETVVFGSVAEQSDNSTLLPKDLIAAHGKVPEGREAVTIGPADVQAYRYQNLRLTNLERPVDVYAIPTTEGVATLACVHGPTGAGSCEAIANTVELTSGESFPVGPSTDYGEAVSAAAGKLSTAVDRGTRALGRAKTPSAQADAARDLRGAYQRASKAVSGLELSPADRAANAQLVAALNGVAAAYGKAASAADKNDEAGYRRATRSLGGAQKDLTEAFAGLRRAGYEIEN